MGILQSILGAFLGGGGVLENVLMQQGGIGGGVAKGINFMGNTGSSSGSSSPESYGQDLGSPIPIGGTEGTEFIDYLLKLKYPYLFNNKGVR